MTTELRDKMRELVRKLNDYAYRYYVLDDPAVTDDVYDRLYDELLSCEKETGEVLPDSPTKRVGGEPVAAFEPHAHIARLYSLDKCRSFDELREWAGKIVAANGGNKVTFTLEYKLDGLTLVVTYNKGLFLCASTRGNGVTGEDVTAQARTIKSIPMRIAFDGVAEAKGECIMRRSAFRKYNETAEEPLKNPRNGAAGALRNLDPKVTAKRNLDMIFYDVNYISDNSIDSQRHGVEWLKNNKFKTEKLIVTSDIEQIISEIQAVDRDSLDFDIDGMVIKVDDYALRESLGYTDKFPRWAIAYKFEAEETTTTVRDVIWQVGRTGKLTPLALLDPVELCGATVRRATLNNYGDIVRKKVRIGSTVFIRRSNDVIPEILSAYPQTGSGELLPPKFCPDCGAPVEMRGANLYCTNPEGCRTRTIAVLSHFVSKDCMDIDGLSTNTLGKFHDCLGVRTPPDIYGLTRDDLLSLEAFKDKKADKLIESIEKSKHVSLSAYINALGIPGVGKKLAADLAAKYSSTEKLSAASAEELAAIDDIGEITAEDIVKFFKDNPDLDRRLKECGVAPQAVAKKEGVLSGERIVFTGKLEHMTRQQAANIAADQGAEVQSSVTAKTTLVVAGEDAGSKLDKARRAGIRIMGESEFLSLVNA